MSSVMSKPYLSLGGTDVTTKVRSITPNFARELHDDTTSGSTRAARTQKAGLQVVSCTVEFNWDSTLDGLLWGLWVGDSPFEVVFRADTGSKGSGNPEYSFLGILENYPVLPGAVGSLHTVSVTFQNADAAGVSRDTGE